MLKRILKTKDFPVIRVTCAIVEQHGRVLVTQRGQAKSHPLLWEFPGGKIEQNEPEEACLVREIMEELHIAVEPTTRLTPVIHDYDSFQIVLIPYVCRYLAGDIQMAEHAAYEWAEPSTLKTYNWCPADIPVVDEYQQQIAGN